MRTDCASSGFHTRGGCHAWQDKRVDSSLLVVLCRCAGLRFALPATQVRRVLGAVQFVSLTGLGGCVVGIVNVANVNLGLCDARIALGLTSAHLEPSHRFIELESATVGTRHWLLWVEEVIGIIAVTADQLDGLRVADNAVVRHALRLPLETVPLLDLAALEPGAVTSA